MPTVADLYADVVTLGPEATDRYYACLRAKGAKVRGQTCVGHCLIAGDQAHPCQPVQIGHVLLVETVFKAAIDNSRRETLLESFA